MRITGQAMWTREGLTLAFVLEHTMPARTSNLTSAQSMPCIMLWPQPAACSPMSKCSSAAPSYCGQLGTSWQQSLTRCSAQSADALVVGLRSCVSRLEVKGSRELAFFKGKAVGPVYPGFCYESEAGAHAAPIAFRPQPHKMYHGSAASSTVKEQESLQGTDVQLDLLSLGVPRPCDNI